MKVNLLILFALNFLAGFCLVYVLLFIKKRLTKKEPYLAIKIDGQTLIIPLDQISDLPGLVGTDSQWEFTAKWLALNNMRGWANLRGFNMRFKYICGELATGTTTRVYRSDCGNFGKVVRTPCRNAGGCPSFGEPKNRFFVWDEPDSAPEYETIEQAKAAFSINQGNSYAR